MVKLEEIYIMGKYRYLPNRMCEITLEVKIKDVVKGLKEIFNKMVAKGWYWNEGSWRSKDFDKIWEMNPPKIIRVKGIGIIPKEGA